MIVGEGFGCGGAVAADDGEIIAGDIRNEEDFAGAVGLDLVTDLEDGAVVNGDGGFGERVGREGGLVDGAAIGQKRVFDPFVNGASGAAARIAEMIEQQSMGPIGNLKYRDYAGDIRQSGQHLLGIINDILDLSKVESGRESLREQVIPAADLLHGVRILLEGRPQEAGVELVFDCPEDLPAINADKRRLTQILVNLLSNAIKFSDAGSMVTLSSRCEANSGLEIRIEDRGIGMSPEQIPTALSIFENEPERAGAARWSRDAIAGRTKR